MLDYKDEAGAQVNGRSRAAAVLWASEGLLEVAAQFVDEGAPDVASRAAHRAALLLDVVGHPDARSVRSLSVDLVHPEGGDSHDLPLADVLCRHAFLTRRDAQYLEAVAGDPRQAQAGSWIEDRDHPHHQADPWVERGDVARPTRRMGERPAIERWRDSIIASERDAGADRAQASAGADAVRIARQGQVPMQRAPVAPADQSATRSAIRGTSAQPSTRIEVDR